MAIVCGGRSLLRQNWWQAEAMVMHFSIGLKSAFCSNSCLLAFLSSCWRHSCSWPCHHTTFQVLFFSLIPSGLTCRLAAWPPSTFGFLKCWTCGGRSLRRVRWFQRWLERLKVDKEESRGNRWTWGRQRWETRFWYLELFGCSLHDESCRDGSPQKYHHRLRSNERRWWLYNRHHAQHPLEFLGFQDPTQSFRDICDALLWPFVFVKVNPSVNYHMYHHGNLHLLGLSWWQWLWHNRVDWYSWRERWIACNEWESGQPFYLVLICFRDLCQDQPYGWMWFPRWNCCSRRTVPRSWVSGPRIEGRRLVCHFVLETQRLWTWRLEGMVERVQLHCEMDGGMWGEGQITVDLYLNRSTERFGHFRTKIVTIGCIAMLLKMFNVGTLMKNIMLKTFEEP